MKVLLRKGIRFFRKAQVDARCRNAIATADDWHNGKAWRHAVANRKGSHFCDPPVTEQLVCGTLLLLHLVREELGGLLNVITDFRHVDTAEFLDHRL